MMSVKYELEFKELLLRELIPALGCTEPIAIALAAAKMREVLGDIPEEIRAECSGNIIKNVQGVVIPNSKGMRGIENAVALGLFTKNSEDGLQLLKKVDDEIINRSSKYVSSGVISVSLVREVETLYIKLLAKHKDNQAVVIISHEHDHFSLIQKNEKILHESAVNNEKSFDKLYQNLSINNIIDFCNKIDFNRHDDLFNALKLQLESNYRIAQEGLEGKHGSQIGRIILENGNSEDIWTKMISATAAGSDARMAGSNVPAVIISGSGNQGITSSVPIAVYAKEKSLDTDTTMRALALADLLTLHQKHIIGRLSSYCGVVSAAASAAASIAYLENFSNISIANIVVNTIVTSGGIICDGAKSSCAGKIATSLESARLAYYLEANNKSYQVGEGLVSDDPEKTIQNIGRIAREGMRMTDLHVIDIMINKR